LVARRRKNLRWAFEKSLWRSQ